MSATGNTQKKSGHLGATSANTKSAGSASSLPSVLDRSSKASQSVTTGHKSKRDPAKPNRGGSEPPPQIGRGYAAKQPGTSVPARKVSNFTRTSPPPMIDGPTGPSEPRSRRRSTTKD